MNQRKNRHDPKFSPGRWATSAAWRALDPHTAEAAHWVRAALSGPAARDYAICSTTNWEGEPAYNTWEANQRALLHVLAEELPRFELQIVATVARLLLATAAEGHRDAPSAGDPQDVTFNDPCFLEAQRLLSDLRAYFGPEAQKHISRADIEGLALLAKQGDFAGASQLASDVKARAILAQVC